MMNCKGFNILALNWQPAWRGFLYSSGKWIWWTSVITDHQTRLKYGNSHLLISSCYELNWCGHCVIHLIKLALPSFFSAYDVHILDFIAVKQRNTPSNIVKEYLVITEVNQETLLLQFPWQWEASNGQTCVQPTFNAGAEEEAKRMPSLDAGFSRPADQKAPELCPYL